MKDGIHPKYNPVIFKDASTGKEFISKSTIGSRETKKVDGVDYAVVSLEVTSDTHPFWTGKSLRLDTTGRIERFSKKYDKIVGGARKSRKKVSSSGDEE